jgi:hypothetical protein
MTEDAEIIEEDIEVIHPNRIVEVCDDDCEDDYEDEDWDDECIDDCECCDRECCPYHSDNQ